MPRLLWFVQVGDYWRVQLTEFSIQGFQALVQPSHPILSVSPRQEHFPPWLQGLENVDFQALDEWRGRSKKRSAQEEVDCRLLTIKDAIRKRVDILNSDNPLQRLNGLAKAATPSAHPYRFQLWFFTYILHKENKWSLKAPTHTLGTWDRSQPEHLEKKFGRPPLARDYPFTAPSCVFVEQVIESFGRHSKPGKSMTKTWADSLRIDFGCRVRTSSNGSKEIYTPDGKPFPSIGQYRYILIKAFGLPGIQKRIYGEVRVRNNADSYEGSFLYQHANLLSAIETDGYRAEHLPSALTHDGTGAVLVVVRGICCASGNIVGVGFSYGGETEEAYRSMLFFMAVEKTYYTRYLGVDPAVLIRWKSRGLPLDKRSDRGPGGWISVIESFPTALPIQTIVPTGAAQSKPFVEGTNPESVNDNELPSFIQSRSTVIELMIREVILAAQSNNEKDVSNRLKDDDIAEFYRERRKAVPNEVWDYFYSRGRYSGLEMDIKQAVRAFWTPIEIEIDEAGAWYRQRPFTSEVFRSGNWLRYLNRKGKKSLRAYVLNMCVRYIWVEIDGDLIELEATHLVRGDSGDLYIPLSLLDMAGKALLVLKSETRAHGQAALLEAREQFKAATGKEWDDFQQIRGRPRKTAASKFENGAIKKAASR